MSESLAVYTHESLEILDTTEGAPIIDGNTCEVVTDITLTFMDVPENSGPNIELPVDGSVARVPNMNAVTEACNEKGGVTVALWDTHVRGKNPTVVSSFAGIAPNTWITLADAQGWFGKDNNPILPTAGFTVDQYVRWLEIIDLHGAMIWNGHADPLTRLYPIHPLIYRTLMKNPNLQISRKGSQQSIIIPGFRPECYSGMRLSTGESLGTIEMLRERNITKVISIGICGDVCEGETAIDLANAGFEVWTVVDAQASIKVPNFGGSGLTSEQLMIQRKIDAGVRFCTTNMLLRVNGFRPVSAA